ncbi:hypothetical protein [Flavobacterium sp.]|uniref:hypothetical protein n=1 Tax=Flavobacterium sp. TaxID=239 RepID=UPI003751B626
MNAKKIISVNFTIALFLYLGVSYAQLPVPFKIRYQSFVKGDMTVIANNIVNRVDYNNAANDPYYNHTNYAKLNDEFSMEYIDIDDDQSTFSSSSAELIFDNPSNKKVIYAALYWSATYKYAAGDKNDKEKFIVTDPGRDSFNSVKLKLPNQETYSSISGQVIYDGINQKEVKDFAPYVVYADITNEVKQLANPTGVYTVANVKATQGMLSGGVAAGWTIFIVYQDEKMSGKFITSFDGFAGVTDKSTDITFNGFQTLPTGNVTAKIACAALEGDNNLIGDQLLFSTNHSNSFTTLSNSIRKENNFFNSCITIENQHFSNRFPDSKNTLGYDTCLFTIPNPNNTIIGNNIKESTLRMMSTGDRYFMFFTAYGVEVTPATIYDELPQDAIAAIEIKNKKVINQNNSIKFIPANNDFLVDNFTNTSTTNRLNKNSTIDSKKNSIEIQTLNISNQSSGYYIIANIFKTEQKAKEFILFLKSKEVEANLFSNPLNNYNYVYLKKTSNQAEALDLFLSKMGDSYKERIQILSINKDALTLVAEANSNKKINIDKEKIIEKNIEKAPFEIQSVTIPNEAKGYYIVANVFSVTENSSHFLALLKSKGFSAKLLINHLNNFKYVYLQKVDNENEAISLCLSKLNNTYQDKMWILSVNNTNTSITNNDD